MIEVNHFEQDRLGHTMVDLKWWKFNKYFDRMIKNMAFFV